MNGGQLDHIVCTDGTTRKCYGGIYAANRLPAKKFKKPQFFIANTDADTKPGQHWVAFYFPRKGPAEFFDSCGNAPSRLHRNFSKFLKRHSKRYVYNKHKLQSDDSVTCGPFVLYYVMHRAHNVPMQRITNQFNKENFVDNDRHITEWLKNV
jgi:hypothetical protein